MKATQELVTPDLVRKITERIVAAYQPQQIILFGSCAYGQPDEDSDIDLLVVMESTLRPVERARQLSDLFPDRRFGIDILVRTPQEIAHRLAVGDEFLSDIIERGKVLKAFLIRHKLVFRRRHDLIELKNLCLDLDPDFRLLHESLATLNL